MSQNFNVKSIQPMPGYVLVEPTKVEPKTASGIYLPDSSEEKPQTGTVLAFGDASYDDGVKIESPVKKGESVVYKKWGGNDFKIMDIEYQFLKFEDILAVIKKSK